MPHALVQRLWVLPCSGGETDIVSSTCITSICSWTWRCSLCDSSSYLQTLQSSISHFAVETSGVSSISSKGPSLQADTSSFIASSTCFARVQCRNTKLCMSCRWRCLQTAHLCMCSESMDFTCLDIFYDQQRTHVCSRVQLLCPCEAAKDVKRRIGALENTRVCRIAKSLRKI